MSPKYASAYRNRGNVYHELKEEALAAADFREAMALEPAKVDAIPASYRK